jgi:hypothetical protein
VTRDPAGGRAVGGRGGAPLAGLGHLVGCEYGEHVVAGSSSVSAWTIAAAAGPNASATVSTEAGVFSTTSWRIAAATTSSR